jgi:hypothetical protein
MKKEWKTKCLRETICPHKTNHMKHQINGMTRHFSLERSLKQWDTETRRIVSVETFQMFYIPLIWTVFVELSNIWFLHSEVFSPELMLPLSDIIKFSKECNDWKILASFLSLHPFFHSLSWSHNVKNFTEFITDLMITIWQILDYNICLYEMSR